MPEMGHIHGGSDDWNPSGSNTVRDFSTPTSTNNQNQNVNAWQYAAQTLKDAGAVTSGALSGTALWQQEGLPENVYHSTFQRGQQAYSPTGYVYIDPNLNPGVPKMEIDEEGNIVWSQAAHTWDPYNQRWVRSTYMPWNPHGSDGPQRTGGEFATNYGYGYGYGGGGGGGGSSGEGYPQNIGAANRYWGPGKARGSTGSPLADLLAYRQANPIRPDNIRKYTQSLVNANRGGIMNTGR